MEIDFPFQYIGEFLPSMLDEAAEFGHEGLNGPRMRLGNHRHQLFMQQFHCKESLRIGTCLHGQAFSRALEYASAGERARGGGVFWGVDEQAHQFGQADPQTDAH